jgi:hypothetical protein
LQNETKYHAIFFKKSIYSPFWILASRGKKAKNKKQKALTQNMKNLAFWMELNTPINFLTFWILSF